MDDTGNGRWLTYSELATIRGINRASAVKLVQRERWPRSTGNDRSRVARVLVPEEWLVPAKEFPADTANTPGMSREDTGMIPALLARAERAEERAYEANKRADVAVALADRTIAELAQANVRAEELRERLDAAEARAVAAGQAARDAREAAEAAQIAQAEAEADAAELREAEIRRTGMGRWARLRAAWRGK